MEILTAEEMGVVDRRTAEEFGVPIATLMENVGGAVAEFCLKRYPSAKRVVVICGKGNNGGDGFVAARRLAHAGRVVRVVLLGGAAEVKGNAAVALAQLRAEFPGVAFEEVTDEAGLGELGDVLASEAELILDAVVGTGFKPPLRGLAVAVRELVAKAAAPVVAVDLPSGWDADSLAQTADGAFRANAVVAFTAPKLAHVFGHMASSPEKGETIGPVVVAGIGSPEEIIASGQRLHWAGSARVLAEAPRKVDANKGRFGHVLVVGGSYGTAGAPSMASLAALRAGAGLVTAAVPRSIADLVAGFAPELMLAPLHEGSEGAIALTEIASLEEIIKTKRISVIALGPGLSTRGEVGQLTRELVEQTKLPIVIDADGLNAFDAQSALLNGDGRVMVLTPHPGEMARLAGMSIADVERDRIGLARRFAVEHKLTLVLKGWRTLIAHPDGSIGVNTTGNAAMAKGGSGDILTGIVAAMLAQYPEDPARAVEAAVFLHGLAGDFAARAMDEHVVLATDTVMHLSDAFRYRVKDREGFTWVCGMA